jgi:HEAT repeat protein
MTQFIDATAEDLLRQLGAIERDPELASAETWFLVEPLTEKLSSLSEDAIFLLVQTARNAGTDEGYWVCISELRRRPNQSVFNQCVTWASDADAYYRKAAAHILAQNLTFKDKAFPILERLLGDSDETVLASALFACGHLTVGDPAALAPFASHPNPDVRRATVSALSKRDDLVSMAALIILSSDQTAHIRDWATFGLGQLIDADSPAIREALFARVLDDDPEARGEALLGLAKRGDDRVLVALERELSGPFFFSHSITAAQTMKAAQLAPFLIALKARLTSQDLEAYGEELVDAIAACSGTTTHS